MIFFRWIIKDEKTTTMSPCYVDLVRCFFSDTVGYTATTPSAANQFALLEPDSEIRWSLVPHEM